MMSKIQKVCVIGAGVMGSGIAAQIANAGFKVLLLDIASKEADKSSIAKAAIQKMLTAKPAPFSHPKRAGFIIPGNLDDDLEQIRDCQLIIEAIVEKLDIKHSLYSKIAPYVSPSAIIASNTSTLQLSNLVQHLPEDMVRNFMILHFFNPPRYMRLLELIAAKSAPSNTLSEVKRFLTHDLGKTVVKCNDTPGFIANRVGCFLLEVVLHKTIEYKMDVEVVDHIFIKCFNLPSTGIFGLYDLIGLDVMVLIANSLKASMKKDDRFVEIYELLPQITQMINENYIGRKGAGGFYRLRNDGYSKVKEVMDLRSITYRPIKQDFAGFDDIKDVLARADNISKAFKEIIEEFGNYVSSLIPEVTDSIYDVDLAMKLGYSWKHGPFEMLYRVYKEGFNIPKFNEIAKNIDPVKFAGNTISQSHEVILKNDSAILASVQDILRFSVTTKMNCLNHDVFRLIIDSVHYSETYNKPLYIYSDTTHFSAGADLKIFLNAIVNKDSNAVSEFISLGQKAMQTLKYCKVPVIAAARGVAVGGGCEILLHSDFVVANQQISAGLVEVGIGLIPAWGGLKEMILRSGGDKATLLRNLKNIISQNKTLSSDYLLEDYTINSKCSMNFDYLWEDATASEILKHVPQKLDLKNEVSIPIFDAQELLVDKIDAHTEHIVSAISTLSGRHMTEEQLLDFERETFLSLIFAAEVRQKIEKFIK